MFHVEQFYTTINEMKNIITTTLCIILFHIYPSAQNINSNPFRQLNQDLPTPNQYRTGSGAPGHEYWQQKADYQIDITLNEELQKINGAEKISYTNNSSDHLQYLWIQLDQNMRAKDSDTYKIRQSVVTEKMSADQIKNLIPHFDGGFKIQEVKDKLNKDIDFTIVKTMMRINLETPLAPGDSIDINIKWWYNINDRMQIGGRSGYEYFPEDQNCLYTIAQFFPRMCVYDDINGWQNKQFLGRGEFALTFGDYLVNITVPADHLVAATGELVNREKTLTKKQLDLLDEAKVSFDKPIIIASEKEAKERELKKSKKSKTWTFKAKNVRDFAFASSRKFIWDAMAVKQNDGSVVMAMSMYPKEGNPLWEKYSTKAVAHTLKWYSHYTFDYPYPVAWSIHAKSIGMEYPMICFNFGRPEKDGTYSRRIKYGMISVIIHEVGHNYFPMIVNSDERQWTWLDEGLNTYLQFLTEQQWERNYPSRRGFPHKIVEYMKGDKRNISPIMSNSESIHQFGNNAYGKPATALNILRETVVGRDNFDFAFKIYANRWKFKHPSPADFFRTIEDASGIDLDWFWRGWFYTTDHVDLTIKDVRAHVLNDKNPKKVADLSRQNDPIDNSLTSIVNKKTINKTQDEMDENLIDFYSKNDPYLVTKLDEIDFEKYMSKLSEEERGYLKNPQILYEVDFYRKGNLVMPIILKMLYEDGSEEIVKIPAEIWKMDDRKVTKVFPRRKRVKEFILDPYLETADIDLHNNYFPRKIINNKFELFKNKKRTIENQMQRNIRANQ